MQYPQGQAGWSTLPSLEGRPLTTGGQNDDSRPLTYTLGGGGGHGVQGQICHILRPQLAVNRFLPLWPHRFPHFGNINLGGGGGVALILDRCRAFDLFASVDAHLCLWLCLLCHAGSSPLIRHCVVFCQTLHCKKVYPFSRPQPVCH